MSLALALLLAACGGGGGSLPLNPISYFLFTSEVIASEAAPPSGGAALVLRLLGSRHLLTCDTATGTLTHRPGPPPFAPNLATVIDTQGCGGLVGVADGVNSRLHIAYVRDSGGGPEVAHAWWNGVIWTIDATVFAVGATGGAPELLLGPTDLLLAFHDASAADTVLSYAEWPSVAMGPWTAAITADGLVTQDWGGNPALAMVGGALYAAHLDSTNGGIRLARCAAACTTPANWTSNHPTLPMISVTGAELDLAVNPANGFLNLLYRDQTATHNLSLREWNPISPFTPGPAQAVMSGVGVSSPEIALAIEPNGRRHIFAWTEAGGFLQLRHRYGFGIFITDGNSPYVVQALAPPPGPIAPLLPVLANGSIHLGWASNTTVLGARWEERTPVF